jgi:hypothetical protein
MIYFKVVSPFTVKAAWGVVHGSNFLSDFLKIVPLKPQNLHNRQFLFVLNNSQPLQERISFSLVASYLTPLIIIDTSFITSSF